MILNKLLTLRKVTLLSKLKVPAQPWSATPQLFLCHPIPGFGFSESVRSRTTRKNNTNIALAARNYQKIIVFRHSQLVFVVQSGAIGVPSTSKVSVFELHPVYRDFLSAFFPLVFYAHYAPLACVCVCLCVCLSVRVNKNRFCCKFLPLITPPYTKATAPNR